MKTVVPAIIPASLKQLQDFCNAIATLPELHVDVVDGTFVPTISWPYEPVGEPLLARSILDKFSLEVDLMVSEPLAAAEKWVEAGADLLVFHIETIAPDALRQFADRIDVTIGVSALNSTPQESLEPYLPFVDYVQVMGIRTIGSQGQPFDSMALERVAWLSQTYPEVFISIDGSVNQDTLPMVATLPIQRYIIGSGITKAPSPLRAYEDFCSLL